MANYHKFVKKQSRSKEFDFPRGSVVDKSMFDLLFADGVDQHPLEFGRNQKDIVEFSVYSSADELVGWKIIERKEVFVNYEYDFIDYNEEHRTGTIPIFDRNYPVADTGEVIISPTHELRELGYENGTHKIGISFKNNIIGSHESSAKLVIKNISPSRTELKIVPTSLKTSVKPLEYALNFEYENFFNQRIPVALVYNETSKFIKKEGLREFVDRVIDERIIRGYQDTIYEIVEQFGMDSYHDVSDETQILHTEISKLFKNVMMWKYHEVYTATDFKDEYIRCIEHVLDKHPRFANRHKDETLNQPYDLYKTTLFYQFDEERVSGIYNARFNSYFSNVLNFGNGNIVPFISAQRSTENINDERKHRPLIVKLTEPLSTDTSIGDKLHISNIAYSDDIIQNIILYKRSTPVLYEMRGPDISFTSKGGTKSYSSDELLANQTTINRGNVLDSADLSDPGMLEKLKLLEKEWQAELYETELSVTDEITRFFQGSTEETFLNVDYKDFKNFIRYSSARKRLDVFIFKLAKLSDMDRQIEALRAAWRRSTPEEFGRLSYDSQMQTLIADRAEILQKFDGYERFLYFEDITELSEESKSIQEKIDAIERRLVKYGGNPQLEAEIVELKTALMFDYVSWPRAEFDCENIDDWFESYVEYKPNDAVVYQDAVWVAKDAAGVESPTPADIPGESEKWELFCRCGECVGKKIPMSSRDYTFLSSRIYYRPMPIPADMEAFSKSAAYAWYSTKAREADFYDKHNDNSFYNNTPEFITRDSENAEYFDFIYFIGHQFDLIHLYVEGIGTIREPRNDPEKGIPNEMVSHMLNYFGGKFSGFDTGEIDALATQVSSVEQLQFIKEFKERKHIIWRRILNNLPHILKSVGTEQSLRAMFRCYGVPDYLFRIREYGGVEYNTDLSDEAVYSFDTFDYYLIFDKPSQYVAVDWKSETYETSSLEFRIGFDGNLVDPTQAIEIVSSKDDELIWSFGVEPEINTRQPGFGKFYFKLLSNVDPTLPPHPPNTLQAHQIHDKVYIKDTESGNDLVYLFDDVKYDILIRRISADTNINRQGIQIYIKRAEGSDIVYTGYAELTTDAFSHDKFNESQQIYFGNISESNFFGRLDRLRIYESVLSEDRFVNHILFNQSYDTDNPFDLEKDLIFKANFDYPYKLYTEDAGASVMNVGYIQNTAFRKDVPENAECYNFDKRDYPYNFSGENSRHFSKLPSYGAQVFNNNKVRVEKQELISQLSVSTRSTLKTNDRMTADTNTLGVFFSPSDLVNHEIIRFFGNFRLGDYIGRPDDLYKETYSEFEKIRHLFYKQGFGKLDFNTYLSIVESYIDPSLFENMKKLVPARTRLISGLIVEPTLLERPKIKRRPVVNEIISLSDVNFNLLPSYKKMVSSGNARHYIENRSDAYVTGYDMNISHKTLTGNWYPTEFGMNYIKNIPDKLMYEVNSYRGTSHGYKIEKLSPELKRYSLDQGGVKKYEAVKISGVIESETWFGCEIYGEFNGWIHESTTINDVLPKIPRNNFINGYARFTYKFRGHRVIGKMYGNFMGQLQQGRVKFLSVVGRIGGKYWDGCGDKNLYSGSIIFLIDDRKLNGAILRSHEDDKTKTKSFSKIFENSNFNAVKLPPTIKKSISIDFDYKKEFRLENESSQSIVASGIYEGNIGVSTSAVFKSPTIATYKIEWIKTHNYEPTPTPTPVVQSDICISNATNGSANDIDGIYEFAGTLNEKYYWVHTTIPNRRLYWVWEIPNTGESWQDPMFMTGLTKAEQASLYMAMTGQVDVGYWRVGSFKSEPTPTHYPWDEDKWNEPSGWGEYIDVSECSYVGEASPQVSQTATQNYTEPTEQVDETLFRLQKSSYDYVHNIISEGPKIVKNISLEKLDEIFTTEFAKTEKPKLSREKRVALARLNQCGQNAAWLVNKILTKEEQEEVIVNTSTRHGNVGEVLAIYSYSIPFEFSQSLKTVDGLLTNPKVEVSMKNGTFSTKYSDATQSREMNLSMSYLVTGDKYGNGYDMNTFFLSLNSPTHLKVGDEVYVKDMKFEYSICSEGMTHIDFNNQFYTITKITNNASTETTDIEFLHGKDVSSVNCGGTYVSGGEVVATTNTSYSDILFEKDGYRLKVTAELSREEDKVVYPNEIDYNIDVGDELEVIFREGSYLWIKRGLRIIENGEVVEVGFPTSIQKKIDNMRKGIEKTKITSKLRLKELTNRLVELTDDKNKIIKIKYDGSDEPIELALNSSHIYSLRITKSKENPLSVRKIKFSKKYNENLKGTSEKRLYPNGYFKNIPINLIASVVVDVETPFEYYNIQDIGAPDSEILQGKALPHRSNFRNVFSPLPKSASLRGFRRSVNSHQTTVSVSGEEDSTPPIVRTYKPGIEDGIGDSFWYLDDTPMTSASDESVTTSDNIIDMSAGLQLHYTFEYTGDTPPPEIADASGMGRHAQKTSALIRDGGEGRLYSKVLILDNDVRNNPDNTNSYISVVSEASPDVTHTHIKTDRATISFWIRPKGISEENAGIVINNSSEKNGRHGIILNPNGNTLSLGYSWENSDDSYNIDLRVPLNHDEWNHVTILIYKEGFVRTFLNKWFMGNYDLGVEHETVTFDKLEIGRVSGMIDDVKIYDRILDYGTIPLNKEAGGEVADLYDMSRHKGGLDVREPRQGCKLQEFDFIYYQSSKFTLAEEVYNLHPGEVENPDVDIESKRKFEVAVWDKKLQRRVTQTKYATTEFMGNLCGRLKSVD